MARAIELASRNARTGRGGPFAAIIVKNGVEIASGVNMVTDTNDPTAHAEIVAIREACRALGHFQLTSCEIYTTCEPCPMCFGAIYWARPERVYYGGTQADAAAAGFDDSFIYAELQAPAAARRIPMLPLMREEALRLFREWQAIPNRIAY